MSLWRRFWPTRWLIKGPAIAVVSLIVLAGVGGCGSDGTQSGSGAWPLPTRPGDPTVYQRIAASTDCIALQREFNRAMETVEALTPGSDARRAPMSYANDANLRMRELGCYGPR